MKALYVAARSGRKGGEPVGGDHRQPERHGRSKRGCALDRQGYDAGKKVTGRKRHVLVDTLGLLPSVVVHPNDVPDRDGARLVLSQARKRFQALDRRAHARLDQPQSPPYARFRTLHANRRSFRAPHHDPHHAQAPNPTNCS